MATADLVHLIDLSLGTEPCGVVNFNYLHGLLHEICKRLVQLEGYQGLAGVSLPSIPLPKEREKTKYSNDSLRSQTDGEGQKSQTNVEGQTDVKGQKSQTDMDVDSRKSQTDVDGQIDVDGQKSQTDVDSQKSQTNVDGQKSQTDVKGPNFQTDEDQKSQTDEKSQIDEKSRTNKKTQADGGGRKSQTDGEDKKSQSEGNIGKSQTETNKSQTKVGKPQAGAVKSQIEMPSLTNTLDGEFVKSQASVTTPVRRGGSGFKSHSSFVSAANDLSALERKLHELEARVNTMESLPELLEKKSFDSQSMPASDLWNFTNINKRIGASEAGLDKAFKLMDELLGELSSIKKQNNGLSSNVDIMGKKLSGDLKTLEGKVGNLEELKLAAAKDSMGDAAATMLSEMTSKTGALESEIAAIKGSLENLATPDTSNMVTRHALSEALSQHEEVLQRHEGTFMSQSESLTALESGLAKSNSAVEVLDSRMGGLGQELDDLKAKMQEMESALTGKVNVSDLASLVPQGGSDEGASLMPKLLELQAKLTQVEAQLGNITVPADLLDRIVMMQNAIDSLQSQFSSLSSTLGSAAEDRIKLDELGLIVAQSRERMAELDRAVTAVSNAVSQGTREAKPEIEVQGAKKFVDVNSFEALQDLLGQFESEQERLIGTVAHLSHEQDISKEHVKSLYVNIEDLREAKADKEEMEVEVRGKADRNALDSKASRDWVDSTFERLDKEIREACSKLMGQEEALKNAVNQLEEDVEGKLDRMELEPLKEYFDKKLEKVKPAAPVPVPEAVGDDAAGFKKPLRFRCISCDKPVGLKQYGPMPALPSGGIFPDTRSFRPYTTYELELIRRHQKLGSPLRTGFFPDFSRSIRSAGGGHTMTRPHQRIRVTPLGQGYTPDSAYHSPPPPRHSVATTASPSVHDEVEIIGQDGHIYKGRSMRNRLPPLAMKRTVRSKGIRPSTSPIQP